MCVPKAGENGNYLEKLENTSSSCLAKKGFFVGPKKKVVKYLGIVVMQIFVLLQIAYIAKASKYTQERISLK